jgi:DNA-binding HxlR family transcriptional regulator
MKIYIIYRSNITRYNYYIYYSTILFIVLSIMQNTSKHKCMSQELKMLGDFWTLMIIQGLSDGEKRFCQLEREIPNTNPTTLTNRLKKLENQKIIKRKKETIDKLSVSYELTKKGKDVLPILAQIKLFAEKHL